MKKFILPGLALLFLSSSASVFAVSPVARQKICETRQGTISQRTSRLSAMATNMITNFSEHATRVENYYTRYLVPKNIILSKYGDLVADIQKQKDLAESSLSQAQTDIATFSCNSVNPLKSLQNYRQHMQDVIFALKNYKTAVKNLIVAVRAAAATPEKS